MVHFTDKQWETVRNNYRKWWKGELGRPILPVVFHDADPGRLKPDVPLLCFSNCADFSITPDQIIDRFDYEISCCEFYGDAYPHVSMNQFGPGVVAAFLGAELEPAENTAWFHPQKQIPIQDMHFCYDPDNPWLNRVKDIYQAAIQRWGGNVCMAMTDLGGAVDVLASFLTTEGLLYNLLDEPEEVKRLIDEISILWRRFYDEIFEILKSQQAYSDWSSILSENPSYMLQCDFAYMIGPDMYKEFALEELSKTAAALDRPFYHLDGIGQLVHLDSLLETSSIAGIQWVPGAGEPETRDWSEVYARISRAGKRIQAFYHSDSHLDGIVSIIKRPEDLVMAPMSFPMEKKNEAFSLLSRYCENI